MNDGNDSKINVLDFSLDHRLNEWLGATRDSWCRTFGTRTVTFQGQSRIRWCHELEITFHVCCHFDRLYLALSQTHDFGLKIKVLILKTGKLKYMDYIVWLICGWVINELDQWILSHAYMMANHGDPITAYMPWHIGLILLKPSHIEFINMY